MITADDLLCLGQVDKSFVSDPENCQRYFLCQNGRALSSACPQSPRETWFNFERQACTDPGPFCNNSVCNRKSKIFVADADRGCGNWHFCVEGQISHSGQCPFDLSFDAFLQYCTYPFCSEKT